MALAVSTSQHQTNSVRTRILTALREEGGEAQSLFKLCVLYGFSYPHAHYTLGRLECEGLVEVDRTQTNRGMIIRLVEAVE